MNFKYNLFFLPKVLAWLFVNMNLFSPFPVNHGCSSLTMGVSLQQGGSNFNVRHMQGDYIKLGLRAKRTDSGCSRLTCTWKNLFFLNFFNYIFFAVLEGLTAIWSLRLHCITEPWDLNNFKPNKKSIIFGNFFQCHVFAVLWGVENWNPNWKIHLSRFYSNFSFYH